MIEIIPETGSTNADLLARVHAGDRLDEGAWLVVDRQTEGRGRRGRDWVDGAGNFMGSTIIRVHDGDPPAATLSLVIGLAVIEVIAAHLRPPIEIALKWPNDVTTKDGAKLAGILLEAQSGVVVAGIGVNLAQAPSVRGTRTASLRDLGTTVSRDEFAPVLADHLAKELILWRSNGLASLVRRWTERAHPPGTPLKVALPGGEAISGTFAGLNDDGALRLRLANGTMRAIHAGDVMPIADPFGAAQGSGDETPCC